MAKKEKEVKEVKDVSNIDKKIAKLEHLITVLKAKKFSNDYVIEKQIKIYKEILEDKGK